MDSVFDADWKEEVGDNVKGYSSLSEEVTDSFEEVDECAVTSERSVFVYSIYNVVKIANSNVMPTLRGFRWYPYFVA